MPYIFSIGVKEDFFTPILEYLKFYTKKTFSNIYDKIPCMRTLPLTFE